MNRVDGTGGKVDGGGRGSADPPELGRRIRAARSLFSGGMTVICATLSLIAALPLFAVLYLLIERGATAFRLDMLWTLPPSGIRTQGGGFGNALLGTIWMIFIAGALAVPFGILAGVHLAEFGRGGRLSSVVRFATKVLTGLPSIIAGVFAYALIVRTTGARSAVAGGVALAVLMLPIVVLTAEEAVKAVPQRMREAAIGMGATRAQVVWKVSLPTSISSILTGVMLAVARAAGETAPLLFTAEFTLRWLRIDRLEPAPSLAVLIYEFSGSPYEHQRDVAWSASLALVAMVLAFNIAGQVLANRSPLARRRH